MKLKVVKIIEIICTCLAGLLVVGFSLFIIQKIAFEDKPFEFLGVSGYVVDSDDLKKSDNSGVSKGDFIIAFNKSSYEKDDLIIYVEEGTNKYKVREVFSAENDTVQIKSPYIIAGEEMVEKTISKADVVGAKIIVLKDYVSFRQTALSLPVIITLCVVFFGGLIVCFVLEKVFESQLKNQKMNEEKIQEEEKKL